MTLDEAVEWLQTILVRRALSPFAVYESTISKVACAKLMDCTRTSDPTAYILFLDKYGKPVLCDCTECDMMCEINYNFIPVENIKHDFRRSSHWQQSTWYLNSPPFAVADWYRVNGWMLR